MTVRCIYKLNLQQSWTTIIYSILFVKPSLTLNDHLRLRLRLRLTDAETKMTFLFLHPPSSSPSIKTLLHPLHLYLLTENITQISIQYIKSKPDMNTTRGILFIAVLLITTLALSILARPESFDDSLYATAPPKNFKGGSGGVGGTKGGSTSKGNNNNNNNKGGGGGGGGGDDGGGVGGYFGPGGGFGIPGFGNGWGSNGGGISGGYGGGYGGPGGGYSKGGIIRPTVECKERGPCYKKKLRCPAKCFTSYSRSGKNYGSGGGGGGCTMDCKKKCIAYC